MSDPLSFSWAFCERTWHFSPKCSYTYFPSTSIRTFSYRISTNYYSWYIRITCRMGYNTRESLPCSRGCQKCEMGLTGLNSWCLLGCVPPGGPGGAHFLAFPASGGCLHPLTLVPSVSGASTAGGGRTVPTAPQPDADRPVITLDPPGESRTPALVHFKAN